MPTKPHLALEKVERHAATYNRRGISETVSRQPSLDILGR